MGLNALDVGVMIAYLVVVTLFGLRFRTHSHSLRGYFLADNTIPWWAITLSIVAAETSTLTIISVPGLAYDKDFRFLQLVFGYIAGRILVSLILIPQYFSGELVTAYQLIGVRFGQKLRTLTAGLFLMTRAAAEGVRVFAVAIVVRIALGGLLSGLTSFERDLCAIVAVTALTLLYTFEGGMEAVIWTDVIQLSIYIAGTIAAVFTILDLVPGGWHAIISTGAAAGKFHLFDLSWSLTSSYTLWSGLIGGAFLTCASHGTDQLIVQRLLAARSKRQSQLALCASGFAVLVQFALFLLVGTMLFVFYHVFSPQISFARTDAIFPTFIVTRLPHGLSGLLISAIVAAAMSNLSAALNSLSSTTIIDFYQRLYPDSSEARRVQLSRKATMVWAVILFLLALLARYGGKVIETGLSIVSVAYGCLLGVFLRGVLTRSATERGAMLGMIVGFGFNLYLWLCTDISFTWYVVVGSALTFVVGYLASMAAPRPAMNMSD